MGEKSTLNAKLNKHFAALGAAAAAITGVGIAQQAEATIVYSGVVNIPVTNTIDGVYMNVVTGVNSPTAASVPGYDINPYQSSATGPAMSFFTSTSANSGNAPATSRGYVVGQTGGTATTAALNLALGAPIGPGSTYNTGVAAGTNFTAGVNGLVGFRFQNEANANAVHYGWARIDRSAPAGGSIGAITEYAYSDVAGEAVGAGVVPEPASLGLLALGAMGLVARRR